MTTLDSALDYHRRGWYPIPIPTGTKNPNRPGWQNERWCLDDLPKQFADSANIGVLLGEPSAGLVDVDLDCPEAIALADGFLPDTDCVFGRSGKAHSHRLYVVDPAPTTTRFRDTDGATLVELRSTGGQTVFPPSTHPTGEVIEWETTGEPGRVTPNKLKGCVACLAAAALLVRHWPSQGLRHDCAMALAGGLAGVGFDPEYVAELVELIARAAGDDDVADRRRAAESTFNRNGDPATGWPALAGILGDGVAAKAREWFGACRTVEPMPAQTAPKATGSKPKGKTPQLQNLADVRIVPVRWLWPDRLPLAKLSLISGDPGTGKSCLTIDLAARVSAGIPWPDMRDEPNPAGGVVLLSAEDALDDTVVPRLRAAGADLTRIIALQGVEYRSASGDEVRNFNLEHDLPMLASAIEQCPGCRLVVLDPVSAYLGETDSHRNAEVRGLLAPLGRLADEHGVAIVCVSHLNKGAGASAIYRTMGSLAFVAAVRSAWCVAKDKDDSLRRLMLPIKVNLCPEPTGMAYAVVSAPMDPSVGMVRWEPEPLSGVDVDEALAADRRHTSTAVEASAEWLEEQLAGGPLPSREIERRARVAAYSWVSCRRAQYALGIKPCKAGFEEGWVWELPPRRCSNPHTHPNERLRLTGSRSEDAQTGECESVSAFAVQLERKASQCEALNPDIVAEETSPDPKRMAVFTACEDFGWAPEYIGELFDTDPKVLRDRASRTDDEDVRSLLRRIASFGGG